MGVWDETTPAGSDNLRDGDDRIRELKVALGEALSHENSTFPGASPSTTPIFIPGFLRGGTADRPTGDSLVEGRLFINTDTNVIERYNGSSWDVVETTPGSNSTDENKLTTSVAGDGLAGGNGTALSVNVDDSTIEINADTLRVKDSGITAAKIAAAVAGNGLGGGGGSALSVNVDDSTIEINSDTLRVKDGGITEAKLSTAVQNKLAGINNIQRGTISVRLNSSGSANSIDTNDNTETITSVDTSKAYIINKGFTISFAEGTEVPYSQIYARLELTNSTTITAHASGVVSSGIEDINVNIEYVIVEWT